VVGDFGRGRFCLIVADTRDEVIALAPLFAVAAWSSIAPEGTIDSVGGRQ